MVFNEKEVIDFFCLFIAVTALAQIFTPTSILQAGSSFNNPSIQSRRVRCSSYRGEMPDIFKYEFCRQETHKLAQNNTESLLKFEAGDGVIIFSIDSNVNNLRVEIYNTRGERVRVITGKTLNDNNEWKWNLTDESGMRVSCGVYIIKFTYNGQSKPEFHRIAVTPDLFGGNK